MDPAKIRLSAEEMALVNNAEWILTKNGILGKVNLLLTAVQQTQQDILKAFTDRLPPNFIQSSPKISRGENYLGLPYMVLDYPRFFAKEDIAVIRTMFWWGNFFSVTLHLAGSVKTGMEQRIITAFPELDRQGFYVGVNSKQWEHHFDAGNYLPAGKMNAAAFATQITGCNFIKLSKKISLEEWSEAESKLTGVFQQLLKIIAD